MTPRLRSTGLVATICFALSTTIAWGAGWGAPSRIAAQSVPDGLAVEPDGTRVLAGNEVWQRASNGTWGKLGTGPGSADAGAMNGVGVAVVAGRDASGALVATVVPRDGALDTQTFTPGPPAFTTPVVAIGSAGDVVVAWPDGGAIRVVTRGATSGSWSALTSLGAAGAQPVAAATSKAGAATVVWIEGAAAGQTINAAHTAGPGGGWSAPSIVQSAVPGRADEFAAAASDSRTIVAWRQQEPDRRFVLRTAVRDGSEAWSVDPVLDARPAFGFLSRPSLAINATGQAIIAWATQHAALGSAGSLAVRRRAAGGAWGAVEEPGLAGGVAEPKASIADDGAAIVAWLHPASFPYSLSLAPRATVAPAGGGWAVPVDLGDPQGAENDLGLAVAIRDVAHAGVSWGTNDHLTPVVRFRELSPDGSPPIQPPLRFVPPSGGLVTVPAHSRQTVGVALNRFVDGLPAVLERQRGTRWVLVRRVRLTGLFPVVFVQLGGPGIARYRVRLTGAETGMSKPAVFRVVPAKARGVRVCLDPATLGGSSSAATSRAGQAGVLCRRDDGSLVLKRVNLATGTVRSGAVAAGPGPGASLADDGHTLWVMRDSTLLPINRSTGRRGTPIVTNEFGGGGVIAATRGKVAVLDTIHSRLIIVDASTRRVTDRILLPLVQGEFDVSVAIGRSGVWVERFSVDTQRPVYLQVSDAGAVERHEGSRREARLVGGVLGVWEFTPSGVRRLDPPSSSPVADLRSLRLDGIVVGARWLWGTSFNSAKGTLTVYRIDPRTGRPSGPARRVKGNGAVLDGPGDPWALVEDRLIRLVPTR